MQGLFDRIAAYPLASKIGVLIGAVVLLCAGYWYFFYSDMQDEMDQLVKQARKLDEEKQEYEQRKREYLAYRNEVNQLLEQQKELVRVLPKTDDIEQFIGDIQAQVELSGLTKVSSVRDPEQPGPIYVKIPIRMSLVGTYHQIDRFFKNVAELKRIVNIEDLSLAPVPNATGGQGTQLQAQFLATTFMFQDHGRPAAGPGKMPATSITAGGGR